MSPRKGGAHFLGGWAVPAPAVTPPEQWVRRWGGKPMKNRHLYIGEFAYWFTWPRVPMLNREHVSVQERDRTRTVLGE